MKKGKLIFSIIVLGMLIFNLSLITVIARDDDFDGIEDEFENLNTRNITVDFLENEFDVQSILRSEGLKDNIRFRVKSDSNGLEINLEYYPEYEESEENYFSLEFSVVFRKLIEYVDKNGNNIYDDSIDQTIQEIEIKDFNPINYSQITITPNTKIHYVNLSTIDGIFTTHFYFSEEFTSINDNLISPTQSKVDIEINNFNFSHSSSQLALYIKLESEHDYEEKEETEDEVLGFAYNETEVFMSNLSQVGFFSWKKTALVDGNESKIYISSIEVDDDDELEQKIYINYPRGLNIYHDPKIGVEGILKSFVQPGFPLSLTIVVIFIISAITISVGYSLYHYRESILPSIFLASEKKKILKKSIKNNSFFNEIENKLQNPDLTAISPDFFKIIDSFYWNEDEKKLFISEMLALNPFERNLILKEMIKKSKSKEE
ncbi:MAG: hypothetical protein ACFFEY_11030 [Candidatus Thorarchaeota archaeon]